MGTTIKSDPRGLALRRSRNQRLLIPFRTLDDGNTIACQNLERPSKPKAWALIDFDGPATPREAETRIRQTLAAPDRGSPT